jgi:hypothetical protein
MVTSLVSKAPRLALLPVHRPAGSGSELSAQVRDPSLRHAHLFHTHHRHPLTPPIHSFPPPNPKPTPHTPTLRRTAHLKPPLRPPTPPLILRTTRVKRTTGRDALGRSRSCRPGCMTRVRLKRFMRIGTARAGVRERTRFEVGGLKKEC